MSWSAVDDEDIVVSRVGMHLVAGNQHAVMSRAVVLPHVVAANMEPVTEQTAGRSRLECS